MATYELSIKANYLPGWGIYEGVRELIQNARDAEVQYDAPMTVKFAERKLDGRKTGAIVIVNEGTVLPKEAMLIGHTSKDGDNRLIGKFGEGLKFGILALLRLGVQVKIRNGGEVWVPEIRASEKYNANVLCFTVSKGRAPEQRVQFEIIGIDKADWDEISSKLLFIGQYPSDSIKVDGGHILCDSSRKGHVYVKGMFVSNTGSHFGYDFSDADIDRDRRMINSLTDKTSSLLANAVNEGHLAEEVFELMMSGASETEYVSSYRLFPEGRKAIAEAFAKHNPGVIAVEHQSQITELEAFGKKGVQVGWAMRTILEETLGSAASTIRELRRSDKRVFELGELTQNERDNLRKAVTLTASACNRLGELVVTLDRVRVVEFHKDDTLGTYDPNTGDIRLARKVLADKGKALYTFVHEVAHTHGGDGIRSHEECIGNIMEMILNDLL